MTLPSHLSSLAQHLVDAQRLRTPLENDSALTLPGTADEAYALQQQILTLRGVNTGGWKIGSKSHTGPIQGSVLPSDCLYPSASRLERAAYSPPGLELEIAFRFNRSFAPRSTAYSEHEVLQAIGSMAAAIEVVSSRFAAWPSIEPFGQLGDLQNHGALIVGEFTDYQDDFAFVTPPMTFTYADENIVPVRPANPAGDPRRLLTWLVNHCSDRGQTLTPETVITCGSYTGLFFPQGPGVAHGNIQGLPELSLTFY